MPAQTITTDQTAAFIARDIRDMREAMALVIVGPTTWEAVNNFTYTVALDFIKNVPGFDSASFYDAAGLSEYRLGGHGCQLCRNVGHAFIEECRI